ncbi:glycosyltransferase family 2 protein [Methylotuvimicrobium sp.]|uniref:glycosyltransferase family 2 protein n=1 Tax=Methylotuvimicrobium sp. TaxID=2822413 RepID=UPI003D6499C3
MKLSVVVPVFNEADNILPLLQEIEAAMVQVAAENYEIIFVDDGSRDETPIVLEKALSAFKALRVIRHRRSCGQSTALYTGIRAAVYPWVATLDGDGQNDPTDILHLHQVFKHQLQNLPELWMVAGWRNRRRDSGWRKFTSKLANTVRDGLLGDKTPDTGCGLKLFLRDKYLLLPYFDHMHRFLPALILRAGGQVVSEPVNHRPRLKGRSKYGTLDRLWVGIVDLFGVIWLQHRARLPEIKEIYRGS